MTCFARSASPSPPNPKETEPMNGELVVAQITDKQPQPACHFRVDCVIDGYPVQLEGQGRADDLRALVGRLRAIGAEPPTVSKPEPTKAAAPLCPVHHVAMAPSKHRAGTYYCKQSVGQHPDDGRTLYCTKKG